jgi:hypothetical protein
LKTTPVEAGYSFLSSPFPETSRPESVNSANANPDSTKLVLAANCTYAFTGIDNQDGGHGGNALPLITTSITIKGNDAVLQRSGG